MRVELLIGITLYLTQLNMRVCIRKRVADSTTKEKMKAVLKDIQSGKFTKEWMKECENGQKNFTKMRENLYNILLKKLVRT